MIVLLNWSTQLSVLPKRIVLSRKSLLFYCINSYYLFPAFTAVICTFLSEALVPQSFKEILSMSWNGSVVDFRILSPLEARLSSYSLLWLLLRSKHRPVTSSHPLQNRRQQRQLTSAMCTSSHLYSILVIFGQFSRMNNNCHV